MQLRNVKDFCMNRLAIICWRTNQMFVNKTILPMK